MSLSHQLADDAATLLFTMDAKTAHASAEPHHTPPPLPKRDIRRASRFLSVFLNSSAPTTATTPTTVVSATAAATAAAAAAAAATMPETATPTQPKAIVVATTHEVYLSSEEDASSLDDVSDGDNSEYNGSEFDDDDDSDTDEFGNGAPIAPLDATPVAASTPAMDGPASAPLSALSTVPLSMSERVAAAVPRRHSHGDKARVVSVVYSGKPSLVDLAVERAERRRSLNDRTTSPTPSTRPSTSASTTPSTAMSSLNVSPSRRLHHKRSSSGSMMASFRVRKALETIADAQAASDADMPRLGRSYTTNMATMPHSSNININSNNNSNSNSGLLSPAPPSPAIASPRAVSGGHSNLLRGVTRTLTLKRRSSHIGLQSEAAANATLAPATPSLRPSSAMAMLPAISVRRRSMVLSAASLGLGGDRKAPPLPQTPEEYTFPTSVAASLPRSSTSPSPALPAAPARRILSRKTDKSAPSTPSASRFFSRRRSVMM